MDKKLYSVNVSALEIRKIPSEASKTLLKKGTIVEATGNVKQYKRNTWVEVLVVDGVAVLGYAQSKYLSKL